MTARSNKAYYVLAAIVAIGAFGFAGYELVASQDSPPSEASHAMAADHEHAAEPSDQPLVDLTDQPQVSMDITDGGFSKPHIRVTQGTTVTWTNRGSEEQTVMAAHKNDHEAHEGVAKENVRSDQLGSPDLALGESYSYTFTGKGTLTYHSALHPDERGTIEVVTSRAAR